MRKNRQFSVLTMLLAAFWGLFFYVPKTSAVTTHEVQVANFSFSPQTFSAQVGDIVQWTWVSGTHTTTNDGSANTSRPAGADPWNASISSSSTTFSYTINVAGTYEYKCVPHAGMGMVGSFTVTVPVELTSFTAYLNNNMVQLQWITATETNNKGFEVQRSFDGANWATLDFINGAGTTTAMKQYSYSDNISGVNEGTLSYRLKQVDYDGTSSYSGIVEVEISTPSGFALLQNYPNPFNPVTTISYNLPVNEFVSLKLYNSSGEEIKVLVNQDQSAGTHSVLLNAAELASGVYYYRISAGEFTSVKKLTLMK